MCKNDIPLPKGLIKLKTSDNINCISNYTIVDKNFLLIINMKNLN